ncbi:hypothetical protein WS68_23595 [Burkholderia sp. TSV86]|nr:hypothetical protein WS68_23595 [Burkholderia sp. TSV86]
MARKTVASLQLSGLDSRFEIVILAAGSLRTQVISNANFYLLSFRQSLDHLIVFMVILAAACSIHHTRHAKAIEFANKLACRIQLVFQRQFRPLVQPRLQNRGVGFCDQHPGRLAICFVLNLDARWLKCLLV